MPDNFKMTIVGRGTAGCLSTMFFRYHCPEHMEVEWIYDSNTPTTLVGEGTDLSIPNLLNQATRWHWDDFAKMNGTSKIGIWKENFGKNPEPFLHAFNMGVTGLHLDSSKFQEKVLEQAKETPNITVIDKKIEDPEDIDATHVIWCGGTPKEFPEEEFTTIDSIALNATYITQCFWDKPQFNYTLAIARPWGWVFGIPLQHRCSIGYMYNKDITPLDIIKEDVKEVFDAWGLTPSDNTNAFSFNNYRRKEFRNGKVTYNGNSGFFYEPMEATSLHGVIAINQRSMDFLRGINTPHSLNMTDEFFDGIELLIAMHYPVGIITFFFYHFS
jgi:hypothetical protein